MNLHRSGALVGSEIRCLAHLHSLTVTMSQKSSFQQSAQFVSEVLTPDNRFFMARRTKLVINQAYGVNFSPSATTLIAAAKSACNCLTVRFCLRDFTASCRNICASLSAKRSSRLGRSGVLNFGSTLSERRYCAPCTATAPCVAQSPGLRIVADIASVASRSITPCRSLPGPPRWPRGKVRTWVGSRWKSPCYPGQLSVEINTATSS